MQPIQNQHKVNQKLVKKPRLGYPSLGLGIGLRSVHYRHILEHQPNIDWFEAISENYMDSQGWPRHVLGQVAEQYPIVLHGVSMSIGSTSPIDFEYMAKLKALAKETNARWISDHLCWTGIMDRNAHDLLPIPLTEESLKHVVKRIKTVQDILERPLVLENPSSYVTFKNDSMPEWEFLSRMAEDADCGLLLDVNNVYVSAFNHGFDAETYIQSLPHHRIVQFHLAGHTHCGTHIIDTHDDHVLEDVWKLYQLADQLTDKVSTLLEWDANIPEFPILMKEVQKAKNFRGQTIKQRTTPIGKPTLTQSAMIAPHPLHVITPDEVPTYE